MLIEKVFYCVQVKATAGRDIRVVSSDGGLDLNVIAPREGIAFPTDTEVEASVGVGPTPQGFGIEVELRICFPGLPCAEADVLVEKSH